MDPREIRPVLLVSGASLVVSVVVLICGMPNAERAPIFFVPTFDLDKVRPVEPAEMEKDRTHNGRVNDMVMPVHAMTVIAIME